MRRTHLFLTFLISLLVKGQDLEKMWRFGFIGSGNLSWIKSETENLVQNRGVFLGYGFGFMVERILASNGRYSFITGLHVNQFGGKIEYKDIVKIDSVSMYQSNPTTVKYSLRYVGIPVIMKMRTNDIGGMRYFIGFGFGLNARWKAKGTQDDVYYVGSEKKTLTKEGDFSDKITFFRVNMEIELGFEYGMTENTWLIVEAFFNNGLTNNFSSDAKVPNIEGGQIKGFPNPSPSDYVRIKGITNFAGIKVGFLF